MTPASYRALRRQVALHWAPDIAWSESVKPPTSADEFALELIYVVCNAGMRWKAARIIFDRVRQALLAGEPAASVFGSRSKAPAIERIWRLRAALFAGYQALDNDADRVEYLDVLPWIGPITKWHAAKNFGIDVAKPDRHLERVAAKSGESPQQLCARLAKASGDRVATVDYVIWRAAESGLLVTRPTIGKSRRGARAGNGHGGAA
jgi:hypothetical protein